MPYTAIAEVLSLAGVHVRWLIWHARLPQMIWAAAAVAASTFSRPMMVFVIGNQKSDGHLYPILARNMGGSCFARLKKSLRTLQTLFRPGRFLWGGAG